MEIFQLFFCVINDVYSHLNAIMLRALRIDLPLLVNHRFLSTIFRKCIQIKDIQNIF